MKLYIETLGCPKNFNDSEGIAGIWEKSGMSITDGVEDADVVLVNTCGFINDAKTESINTIFDMIREERPILVVSGCLSQRYGTELAEEIPEIDIIIGVNDYEKLPEIVSNYVANCKAKTFKRVFCNNAPLEFAEFSARKINENPYSASLRIAEGCNNCCAYCVIPQIRGRYRSRPAENILEEANMLAEAGTKEIILIAQDVTEYGRDLYGKLMLPNLLKELCAIGGADTNKGFKWIRLMYCYEDKITDELIEVMASEERICNYIDIPLQHFSNSVLKRMNRRSTSDSIGNTLYRLRKAIPDIHIRTTLIVGFPGETEEEFEELLNFVSDTKFERLGVFAYSREEGTAACEMEDQIAEEIKEQRVESIMRRQLEISNESNMGKIGKSFDVLVEGEDEDGAYVARTMYDAPEIDDSVIFASNKKYIPGDFAKLRIVDAYDYDLVGEVCD